MLSSLGTELYTAMAGGTSKYFAASPKSSHVEGMFGYMANRTKSQVDLHFTKPHFQNTGRGETIFLNPVTE